MLIFTSDHGEEFREHGKFKHGKTVYEEVLRVPLFIKVPAGAPGINQPARIERNVNTAVIAPTILDILGFHVPDSMQVGSLFDGTDDENEYETLFFGSRMHTGNYAYAAIKGDRKFIASAEELETGGQYYDLVADPGEEDPLPLDKDAEGLRSALADRVEENARLRKFYSVGPPGEISKDDFRALGYVK